MTNKYLEPFLKRRGLLKKPISGGDGIFDIINALSSINKAKPIRSSSNSQVPNNDETQSDNFDGIESEPKKNKSKGVASGIKSFVKKLISKPPEENLALQLTNAIKKGLQLVSQKSAVAKDNQINIEKLFIPNPIDLDYGGGLLVFGPDFEIQKVIHLGIIDNLPKFAIEDAASNMNISKFEFEPLEDIGAIHVMIESVLEK